MTAQIDAFACFGSDSDAESGSDSNSISAPAEDANNNDKVPINDVDVDRRKNQHLIDQENARIKRLELARYRRTAAVNVLPITNHDRNYEVFEEDASSATPSASGSRGKGVRAKRSYEVGDEILREYAVMRIPTHQAATTFDEAQSQHHAAISDAFASLSPTSKEAVLDLSVCERWQHLPRHIGVYQTNSYELRGEADGGLFLTTARINHSCRPNANHVWRADLQRQVIFCCRDIKVGEEILVTYGPTFSGKLDAVGRRDFLREKFSFDCQCSLCSEGDVTGGYDRMRRIQSLRDDIAFEGTKGNSEATLRKVEECILLLQEQGLGGGSFALSLFRNAHQNTRNASQARSYLERELAIVRNIEGVGCIREGEIRYQLSQLG